MSAQLIMNFEPTVKPRKRHIVRQTSREAYTQLRDTGTIGHQAQVIRDWIARRGSAATLQEISRGTGIPINAVAGRVNDCKKVDVLHEWPKRTCSVTGNTVTPVHVSKYVEAAYES